MYITEQTLLYSMKKKRHNTSFLGHDEWPPFSFRKPTMHKNLKYTHLNHSSASEMFLFFYILAIENALFTKRTKKRDPSSENCIFVYINHFT